MTERVDRRRGLPLKILCPSDAQHVGTELDLGGRADERDRTPGEEDDGERERKAGSARAQQAPELVEAPVERFAAADLVRARSEIRHVRDRFGKVAIGDEGLARIAPTRRDDEDHPERGRGVGHGQGVGGLLDAEGLQRRGEHDVGSSDAAPVAFGLRPREEAVTPPRACSSRAP